MNQTITAKLQIVVSDEDKILLHDTMIAYAKACDFVSAYVDQNHTLKVLAIHNAIYRDIRNKFNLRSQMAISCIRTVVARYKTILENQKEWIQPKFKHPQLDLVWNRDYSLIKKDNVFSVNTLVGRIKVPFYKNGYEQYFSEGCKFGTAKLVYKHGKFFLHIPITYAIEVLPKSEVTNVVGIDRGIRFLAVAYDDQGKTLFFNGKTVIKKRAHYKELRRRLQKRKTASSRKRIRTIGQRENRWMQDVNHCVSKALVTRYPKGTMFVIEDLKGIREVTERVKENHRYVSVSWSFYDLEQKLIYKALQNRQWVEKVNPAFTSQCCPKCGHIKASNRNKKKHYFRCKKCGYWSNDDRVAAMNLHQMGIELLVPGVDAVG